MSRVLDVYWMDELVGKLMLDQGGSLRFRYLETASHSLSLSLPWQLEAHDGPHVRAYFSGLLPDEGVRSRLAAYLGVSHSNAFALLEAVGGDCAGAVALYPEGQAPSEQSHEYESLDDVRLSEILEIIKGRPLLAGSDEIRLSLAGAQDKLAVGFKQGTVLLMKGGAPTTHILKPMLERVSGSVHNEFFCMRLALMVGLNVPKVSLHWLGDVPYYLVERYDRILVDGVVKRLHQEDFCQAMGLAPEIKYQREGGPSITQCLALLDVFAKPAVDRVELINRIIFNYLVGNADAHGKNFSVLYKGGRPHLAPAYDLLSTAIYPELSVNMAMKIGGKYHPLDVRMRHFERLMGPQQSSKTMVGRQVIQMRKRLNEACARLKNQLVDEGLRSDIFDAITHVIEARCNHLTR